MSADYEVFATSIILSGGEQMAAEFLVWDSDPADTDQVKLALKFAGKQIVVSDDDYVAVLRKIRLQLEQDHILLNCYGASRNAHVSPMSSDMGAGWKAYRLKLGEQAKIASLVSIFETGADVDPVTVAEQDAFFEAWKQTL
ncbi:MAG: hypothetical protein ABI700_27065 [Chloroflexota bacterium]